MIHFTNNVSSPGTKYPSNDFESITKWATM